MKKLCVLLAVLMLSTVTVSAAWTDTQTKANQIANIARSMGLSESSVIITEASRIWWEEENNKVTAEEQFLIDHQADAVAMAHVMFCEARGLDARELSMVAWCILNRVDDGRFGSDIMSVITAPHQFAYNPRSKVVSDRGVGLVWLAEDVLLRWYREKQGVADVGRTLPAGYIYYYGNGRHNLFRMQNSGRGSYNFGLWNPYEGM